MSLKDFVNCLFAGLRGYDFSPDKRIDTYKRTNTAGAKSETNSDSGWDHSSRMLLFLSGFSGFCSCRGGDFEDFNFFPLQAFSGIGLLVLDNLAVPEAPETVDIDTRIMDEYVLAFFVNDESEALFRVEPFYSTLSHKHLLIYNQGA